MYGTDLVAVKNALCPNYKVHITNGGVPLKQLNYFYNMADVTINIASNEGFGLSGAESLMTGTPIINNVTGGLQDHMRFEDEDGNWVDFNTECQGSPLTPYIFDDRVDFRDVAKAIKYWYDMSKEERDECGMAGHDWVNGDESNMSAKNMSALFIKHIDTCLEKWTPRKRFSLYKSQPRKIIKNSGVIA